MAETLEQSFAVPFFKPEHMCLFENPNGVPCLEYEGAVYWKIGARRALPHQFKNDYIFLYNYNDDEIGAVRNIRELSQDNADRLQDLLQKRYFIREIREVYSIDDKFSLLIFKVRTDRKHYTDFTVLRPKDNIYRSRTGGFLVNDVDNNLFHIEDRHILSPKDLIRIERYC